MSIAGDVQWFMGLAPTPPTRLHTRGVWAAPREGRPDDGHGSELGSPATSRAFRNRTETPFAHTIEAYEGRRCIHPGLSQARVDDLQRSGERPDDCVACGGSGLVSGEDERYADAYAAAMTRMERLAPVHARAPKPFTILFQLQCAEGDVARMADFLSREYSCMTLRSHIFAHLGNALRLFRDRYTERDSPRYSRSSVDGRVGKSESQSAAEVSA